MSGDDVSIDEGEITMAMTAAERVRAVRERRRRREIQLTVVMHQDDLGEIARRGYEGAASTDRALRSTTGETAEDLKDMGFNIVGHRRVLLDAIKLLGNLFELKDLGAQYRGDDVSIDEGEITMAMTAAERVRAVRERRRRREIQLTVVMHQDDLGEIARRGYEGAASTDRARQGEAVQVWITDVLWG
jgi:pyridoxal biosynthesis lyase PdxS